MDVTGRRILVVDDDAMVLMGLSMILESWGMTVLAAEDLPQALDRLDGGGRPQVILSDLRLRNGLSGFEVVDRVREVLGEAVPAVILTGETAKSERDEGHRRRLAFLHKPVLPDALRRTVAAALTSPA